MQAGWDWVGQRGLGTVALFFSAYHSRAYGIESPLELADERFHMNFFYIGPEFVARLFFSDYWSVKTGLGLRGILFALKRCAGTRGWITVWTVGAGTSSWDWNTVWPSTSVLG